MEITVKDYLQCLDKHALVRLEWQQYAMDDHTYDLWLQSPFANCIFMNVEYTLKNMINHFEWIGDMAITGIKEEDHFFIKSGEYKKIYKIQF